MQAWKCDRCGALFDTARGTGGLMREQMVKVNGWARALTGAIVKLYIQPQGDPTGYGGMELCNACILVVLTQAKVPFGLEVPRRSTRKPPRRQKRSKQRGPAGAGRG